MVLRKSLLKRLLEKVIILFIQNLIRVLLNGDRIRDKEGNTVACVQCRRCLSLLTHDPRKIGTSSLSTHSKSCRATRPNSNPVITTL